MEKGRKNRVDAVDVLRGFAACMMILGHAFIQYPVNIQAVPWCYVTGHFIYTFHMELFFFLAGFVYRCRDYEQFARGKLLRLGVPYLFFGVATLLLRAFGGAAIHGTVSVTDGVRKLLLSGGGYWFIYTLLGIFLVYPWAEKLLKKPWMELAFGGLCLVATQLAVLPDIFCISAMGKYLPYFILGHYFAIHRPTLSRMEKWASILSAMGLYLGMELWALVTDITLGPILHFVRAMALIGALWGLAQKCTGLWEKNALSRKLHGLLLQSSRFSLQLYLFNGYLLTAGRILICSILGITAPAVIVAGIWLINLVVTLVSCRWIIPRIPLVRTLCGIK